MLCLESGILNGPDCLLVIAGRTRFRLSCHLYREVER
jgi:hypothetical protein